MKEHPIPQDITSYRFHIVGSMTLKQFGEVAGGVILALGIYQTNLVFIIKWPLIIICVAIGFIAAFLPIGERPLSHWVSTFIRILYKPTQFFWKRTHNIPEPFLYKGKEENMRIVKEIDLTPARRQRIKEFISSQKRIIKDETVTTEEQAAVDQVMSLFQNQPILATATQETLIEKPDLTVRVRSLRLSPLDENQPTYSETIITADSVDQSAWPSIAPESDTIPATPANPDSTGVYVSANFPTLVESTIDEKAQDEIRLSAGDGSDPTTLYVPANFNDVAIMPDENNSTSKKQYLTTEQVAQNIDIPVARIIHATGPSKLEEDEEPTVTQSATPQGERAFIQQSKIADEDVVKPQTQVTLNASLPFPSKPTEPNKLVGMVLTTNNELIPGAIVEITTPDGGVARAVKTNALGQFFVATPLKNGKYTVSVEKEGFSFKSKGIELNGKAVDPLEIRSN